MTCVTASTEEHSTIRSLASLYMPKNKFSLFFIMKMTKMLPLTPEQNNIINAILKELEREYQLDHILYHTITAL